jgi:putative ABC transport system permease protein
MRHWKKREMFNPESFRFSIQALRANKIRTLLTSLGLVIGNASVILVVTISTTAREFVLDQIRAIGSNMVYAEYESGTSSNTRVNADFIKLADLQAVRQQLSDEIVAATGVMTMFSQMRVQGREEDIAVNGVDEYYPSVRNLQLLAGRFIDGNDVAMRSKVAVLTERLARRLYGSQQAAIGQQIKIQNLQFDVIGTFKERAESFGLSELASETVVIPLTVQQYFEPVERIDPMYVQARSPEQVEPVTRAVRRLLEGRHRPGARYKVENLSAILDAAKKIGLVLSVVLMIVSAIALIISGIGIMNIMLVTVTERTREIGLRMAVGASRRDVLEQFLTEAILISVGGGLAGIVIGVGIPLTVDFLFPEYPIPISVTAIFVAFAVSLAVGLVFGILPANRAARLNPTEALRYE